MMKAGPGTPVSLAVEAGQRLANDVFALEFNESKDRFSLSYYDTRGIRFVRNNPLP